MEFLKSDQHNPIKALFFIYCSKPKSSAELAHLAVGSQVFGRQEMAQDIFSKAAESKATEGKAAENKAISVEGKAIAKKGEHIY